MLAALPPHPDVFEQLLKILLLAFVFIWLRWTFPRLREDQLQSLAWRWLIPLSLANILITGTFKVVF